MRAVLLALLVLVAFVGVQAVELESDACGGKDYGESGQHPPRTHAHAKARRAGSVAAHPADTSTMHVGQCGSVTSFYEQVSSTSMVRDK